MANGWLVIANASELSVVAYRAKAQAIPGYANSVDCFVAYAPLRKRFAFVAGNDAERAARSPRRPGLEQERRVEKVRTI
jgi:hypothetical protein